MNAIHPSIEHSASPWINFFCVYHPVKTKKNWEAKLKYTVLCFKIGLENGEGESQYNTDLHCKGKRISWSLLKPDWLTINHTIYQNYGNKCSTYKNKWVSVYTHTSYHTHFCAHWRLTNAFLIDVQRVK